MKSADGSAVAAWLSGVVGVAAIIVAAIALINDRRRAHLEDQRIETDRVQRMVDFVTQATQIVGFATGLMSEGPSALDKLSHELPPIMRLIEDLRRAAPADVFIALALSRIVFQLGKLERSLAMPGIDHRVAAAALAETKVKIDEQVVVMRDRAEMQTVKRQPLPREI